MIDIMISSCARVSLLEPSILSAKKHLISADSLHWVLVEDFVENRDRYIAGKTWVDSNKSLFDEVIYLPEKAGVGYWWQKLIFYCTTTYHVHLEDDNVYIKNVLLDKLITILNNDPTIIAIIFNRQIENEKIILGERIINDISLIELGLMSIAAGVFNTANCRRLLSEVGIENKIHEYGTLTPAIKKLGFKCYMMNEGPMYDNIGHVDKYRKGNYE